MTRPPDLFALASAIDETAILEGMSGDTLAPELLQALNNRGWYLVDRAVLDNPRVRLEELRAELRAERISYGELAELADLAEYIGPGDVELTRGGPAMPIYAGTAPSMAPASITPRVASRRRRALGRSPLVGLMPEQSREHS